LGKQDLKFGEGKFLKLKEDPFKIFGEGKFLTYNQKTMYPQASENSQNWQMFLNFVLLGISLNLNLGKDSFSTNKFKKIFFN
jgi:hypothetical protein